MALAPGTRIGVYEVSTLIGSGGMGEVYRARDTRLGREVALKILPPGFATDPDRLARFEREAQVLAALNHPRIAAIYGIEETDGAPALVMELVGGETLERCLTRGPIPVQDTLTLAIAIADAIEAAHEKGIVHRDLKPANISVTGDGTVKILDFGLAKIYADKATGSPHAAGSDFTLGGSTRENVIFGTPAYMSPEQARGRPLDKRCDVWAFGCILFEMLTGVPAFARETVTDTLVAVLELSPDWSALPAVTPAAATRVLRRCLEKDYRRRLRDIGDARIELEDASSSTEAAAPAGPIAWRDRDVELRRLTDFPGSKESPALSPDGKIVAFVAPVGGKRQIWIRMLAGGAPLQLTRDESDHVQPRWAPDSSTLLYHLPPTKAGEYGAVSEISALGGWPRKIAPAIGGGDVSRDGRRVALFQASGEDVTLTIVARDGSRPEKLVSLPRGYAYSSPRWSPDDRWIAFLRIGDIEISSDILVVPANGGRQREVCQDAWIKGFCWLPDATGFVYSSARGSTLLYPPLFNLRAVTLDGRRDRQLTFGEVSYVEPDCDSAGRIVASRIRSASDIWKIAVSMSPAENARAAQRITDQSGHVRTPSGSPDDSEIVYISDSGGHGNLWVARTDGSGSRQITFEQDARVAVGIPAWSPVDDVIAFVLIRDKAFGLWIINADGSGLRQVVPGGRGPCWSRDGRWIYYEKAGDGWGVGKLAIDGGEAVTVRAEDGATGPAPSADGSELFYLTTRRANMFGLQRSDKEVRRLRNDGTGAETLARIAGERLPGVPAVVSPAVSPDGRWLALPLADGATCNVWLLPTAGGPIKAVTDFGGRSIEIARSVSWSSDGQYIWAAIDETATDVVLFDGLI